MLPAQQGLGCHQAAIGGTSSWKCSSSSLRGSADAARSPAPGALRLREPTPFDNSLRTEFDLNVVDLGLPQYWAYALASENLQTRQGVRQL